VVASQDKLMADVGHIYGRVAERWDAYLSTLTKDEVALATRVITAAAEINREEVERLRRER